MKDGKTVSQEQTLNIETHRNDSGKYWCLAENGLNSTVNASAMLDVQCKKWLLIFLMKVRIRELINGFYSLYTHHSGLIPTGKI